MTQDDSGAADERRDLDAVLGHRHDNGADFWATVDGRIYVGNPYSTISSLCILHELRVGPDHEAVAGALELVAAAVRDDGRVRVAPRAPLHPCYSAEALRALVRFRGAEDADVVRGVARFLDDAHETGGWRCSFSRFGKGPETRFGSPGATLYVLDVLRFFPELRAGHPVVNGAVDLLLGHWETRKPLGPCHHGIGTAFLQVEYPFVRYNLFYYAYVLSHFERARRDERFGAVVGALAGAVDDEGRVVVKRPHRGLKELRLCARGLPSVAATRRYGELVANLEQAGA